MTEFRLHILGLPHTLTDRAWSHCAYTQKQLKMVSLFAPRGHEIIHYGNGTLDDMPDSPVGRECHHITLLTEKERQGFFGKHDKQKLYHVEWSGQAPYWKLFNERLIVQLKQFVRKGDFILCPAGGDCFLETALAFPGSHQGIPETCFFVESGIGYYGVMSRYRIFESNTHREWMMGAIGQKGEDNDTAVAYNFFDKRDFVAGKPSKRLADAMMKPYLLFIGRVISDKGIEIAVEVAQEAGLRLIVAGQTPNGEPFKVAERGKPRLNYRFVGAVGPRERAILMTNAVAVINPTRFREPFGGTAVEAQMCGTPAITTDQGAFCETVERTWRCTSHREFLVAVERARKLKPIDRKRIRARAEKLFSLEAVAPVYEAYFERLYARWWGGWYERRDLSKLQLP